MWLGIMQIVWHSLTAVGKVNICHILFFTVKHSPYNLISVNRLQTANKASTETKETTTAITRKPLCDSLHFYAFAFPFFSIPSEWSSNPFSWLVIASETAAPCLSALRQMIFWRVVQRVAETDARTVICPEEPVSGDISLPDLKVIRSHLRGVRPVVYKCNRSATLSSDDLFWYLRSPFEVSGS